MHHIEKYTLSDIQKKPDLMEKISSFIYETFLEIDWLYDPNMNFYKEIKEWPDLWNLTDESNRFYIIRNTEKDIIACMWWTIKEVNLNPEMGDWGSYYSKYIASHKDYKRQWLSTFLKKEFEKEAEEYAKTSKKYALVISGVLKNNNISRERNLSNWYKEWINPKQPEIVQYYKSYSPDEKI